MQSDQINLVKITFVPYGKYIAKYMSSTIIHLVLEDSKIF